MIFLEPYPKQIKKYFKEKSSSLKIPDQWLEFARLCKIRSAGSIINFEPYDYQIKLVNTMLQRSCVIIKSRQLGISETITSFMLWRAFKNPGYLGLVFSKTQTDSSLIARRMRRMIDGLSAKTTTENLCDIELVGGGRILFRNSKPESARGIESVVDVFLDELAFIDTAKEVYDALAPSQQMVGADARVFAVSTPNGKDGFYWDLASQSNGSYDLLNICQQVSKGELNPYQEWVDQGNWGKVIIHWRSHPVYGSDPDFLKKVELNQKLSRNTIDQEYNLSFSDSSSSVFSTDLILKNAIAKFEKPIQNGEYFFGIDASGLGGDYAVCVVLKKELETYKLVECHREKNKNTEYHIQKISELIKNYNPIKIGLETTGGYGQIWFEILSKNFFQHTFKTIKTTQESKKNGIDRLLIKLETNKLIFPFDSFLTQELRDFRFENGKFSASKNKHDDVLMATIFAIIAGDSYD
ncbi:MAG: hypothetical protein B7C55_11320 [Actinomycetales bacterium mxb001]|nr:MAG: hypothetical protein B7C55_11320 [Actinomycetales bacterium mxb001]